MCLTAASSIDRAVKGEEAAPCSMLYAVPCLALLYVVRRREYSCKATLHTLGPYEDDHLKRRRMQMTSESVAVLLINCLESVNY